MKPEQFTKAWRLLKMQVGSLHVPWLENAAAYDRDPFKILISCILSLRTQDKVTGEASERLFALASDPKTISSLNVSRIEKAIYPVGFYRVKARRIKALGRDITERYSGRVPDTVEELLALKGVGRKTANLVVTLGFRKPGICVDTHVHRITNRWGLVNTKTPHQTEYTLRDVLPQEYWIELNGMLVAFGQGICKPVSPLCSRCRVSDFCDRVGLGRSR
jgi:endonuclease III